MKVLCLDASLARCSAAIVEAAMADPAMADQAGAVLAEAEAPGGQGQAASIAVLAEAVLAEARLGPGALAAVAATVGPGGFTGIRAALSLARGLADGAAIPLIAVTTAEALAAPRLGARPVAVLIDSRRGHRFVQVFAARSPGDAGLPRALGEAVALAPAEIGGHLPAGALSVGDAPEAAEQALPLASDLAAIAVARRAGRLPPLAPLPLYLDAPAARPATGLRPAPAA